MRFISSTVIVVFTIVARCLAQTETQTAIVTIPASTAIVETTLTSYSPDTTVTVTPTVPDSPQYTNPTDLIDSVLNSTNFYRYEHNASFLLWNASLASYASNYAKQCMWAHSHGPPGENLARGYPDVTSAVDAWGNERALYDFNTPSGFTEATGHFTQLVWKSTQTVGCGAVNCNGTNGVEGWYLVCEYWPAGNIVGQGSQVNSWFVANVQSQVNSGVGFAYSNAIAGAGGVGTSWASTVPYPAATSTLSAAAAHRKSSQWEAEVVGGVIALFGAWAW